jgi:hypothetical protein
LGVGILFRLVERGDRVVGCDETAVEGWSGGMFICMWDGSLSVLGIGAVGSVL